MSSDNNGTENKVIFLGEAGVGKTTLIKVSIGQKFDKVYNSSISLSFNPKKIIYENKQYTFNLWDTIGQEKYRSLTKLFYKDSKVVIFVYDITNKKSFKELNYWINEIKESLGNEPVFGIVGNKIDLEELKEVEDNVAKKFAEEKGIKFKLVSTKEDPKEFKLFLRMLVKDYIIKSGGINVKENLDLEADRDMNNHGSCLIF